MKLLSYLYHNNREPITKIAKSTQLTRQQVDYKINNYISSGFIDKFATVFNYSKLGFGSYCLILIKLEQLKFKDNFLKKFDRNFFKLN